MSLLAHLKLRLTSLFSLLLILFLIIYFQLFFQFSQLISDTFFVNKPGETEIVLVTIDEASLRSVGEWPWKREKQAELLETISKLHPKAIGYDVVLVDSLEDQIFFESLKDIENLTLPSSSALRIGQKGHVEVIVSKDGKVRNIEAYGQNYQAFPVVVSRLAGVSFNEEILQVNYRFAKDEFTMVSAQDILALRNLEKLRNKIVLIGVTAPELHDFQDTPLGYMSGLELQANAVDTITAGRTIKALALKEIMIAALLLATIPGILLEFLGLKKTAISIFVLLILLTLSAFIIFNISHLMMPLFYWSLAIVSGSVLAGVVKMMLTDKERTFLRRAFSQYVNEDVLQEILKNPKKLALQGKSEEISVLFLDIRGFTSFAEEKSPQEVVDKLNELLEIATNVIFKYEGTLDKYMGDCVMAFWGAPLKDKLQATHACQAASEIQKKIQAESNFKVGIGINYGKAIVGNIGSSKHLDYTAIGDVVNTAARLETATKDLNQAIVIAESVVAKVEKEKSELEFKKLKMIKVKGKRQGIKVVTLKSTSS